VALGELWGPFQGCVRVWPERIFFINFLSLNEPAEACQSRVEPTIWRCHGRLAIYSFSINANCSPMIPRSPQGIASPLPCGDIAYRASWQRHCYNRWMPATRPGMTASAENGSQTDVVYATSWHNGDTQ